MARRLAWAGIVFPPLFVVVFLILGFVKPNYNPVRQFVSEGSIGQLGWVQVANFLVSAPRSFSSQLVSGSGLVIAPLVESAACSSRSLVLASSWQDHSWRTPARLWSPATGQSISL